MTTGDTTTPTTGRATILDFFAVARALARAARARGLVAPVFVSPPRRRDADRTLRTRNDGAIVVAVRRAGRPFAEIAADMIEGIVAANGLDAERADACRAALRAALGDEVLCAA